MAHIQSIGAGMFSDLSVAVPTTAPVFANLDTEGEFNALFASEIQSAGGVLGTNTYVRVKNVREFPAMGTPPNIVNVPTYGQKTSQQIQGQADEVGRAENREALRQANRVDQPDQLGRQVGP